MGRLSWRAAYASRAMAATLLWALDRYAGKKRAKRWGFWWEPDPEARVAFEAAFGWLSLFLALATITILSYFPLNAMGVDLYPMSWLPILLLSLAVSGFLVNISIHLLSRDDGGRPSIIGDVVILAVSSAAAIAVCIQLAPLSSP